MSRVTLAALGLILATEAFAARPAVRHYDLRAGLPQTQVSALHQDRGGFLWVGTLTGGLGRYDGRRFEVFDVSSGLPGASVNALAEDDEGVLYVATGGGAARRAGDGFAPLLVEGRPLRRAVSSLLPRSGAGVLLGTQTGVLHWTDDSRPVVEHRWAGGEADAEVTALARDGAGTVWVGTTRGLARLRGSPAHGLDPTPGLPPGKIAALLARPGRPLLVSIDEQGVFEGGPDGFARVGGEDAPGRRVLSLLAERDDPDTLWFGTDRRGSFCRRQGRFERFSTAEGLSADRVNTILEDQEGVLWFGTEAALTKRGPSAFVLLDEADGLPPDQPIFGMTESRDGALWFAAWDAGVVRSARSGAVRRFTARDGLPDARVVDVAAHPAGGVVVATRRGLARIEGDRVRAIRLPAGVSLDVRTVVVAPDGRILAGTRDDGLVVVHPDGRVERVRTPAGEAITALYLAPDGVLWVGTGGGGAYGVVGGAAEGHRLTHETGLPSDFVTSFLVDSRGTFWVTTDVGAYRRDADGRVRLLDRRHGLPDSFLYWVGEDAEGALWFGTNRGAARMDANGAVKVFTSRDGLGIDECNEDGFLVDSRGDLYVGTVSVSRYLGPPRPRRRADPPVHIESVLADGRPVTGGRDAVLPRRTAALTFRFVAPSFTDEDALRYRYRLLGLGEAFTESGAGQGETTYGGLAPGRYTFEVLAVTSDGRISKEPAAFTFAIRPAWWETQAALVLLVLALLAVGLLGVRVREAASVAARQRLEREVRERTDELRRANERLAALAVTDELTGVANRRRVLEAIEEAMAFARRRKSPLSVLVADLDRFKEVNDRFGHAAGDEVLRAVAKAMEEALRTEDVLGRYGGDEFLAVLPGTGGEGARDAGQRLRAAVRGLGFGPDLPGGVTISVGVASFDGPAEAPGPREPAELVRRADEALYRAKAAGRDQVSG